MRKGFTLLELLIVIIIIGVLAVVALTQYKNLSERARMSEAKSVIGSIRTAERIYHEDQGKFGSLSDLSTYIVIPPASCAGTHWFEYAVSTSAADGFTVNATRCASGGKEPNIATGSVYNVWFTEDLDGNQTKGTNVGGGSPTSW